MMNGTTAAETLRQHDGAPVLELLVGFLDRPTASRAIRDYRAALQAST